MYENPKNMLKDAEVRIVCLPSVAVAAVHITGQNADGAHAEAVSAAILSDFIERTNLGLVYPAARSFGFNNPDAVPDDDPNHGYERWITIPANMEVVAPFIKKRLGGGLYASYRIQYGDWEDKWIALHDWVRESEQYDFRWNTINGVCGWLEEHLDYGNWHVQDGVRQIDLMIPIKFKS